VTSIYYIDPDGNSTLWSSTNYVLVKNVEPARIVLAYNCTWPATRYQAQAVTIVYVSGYGASASAVPQRCIHALKLLIRHWFENRSPVNIGNIVNDVPQSFNDLCEAARVPDDFLSYGIDNYAT
jgi:uncharacterized phiE125 gp8 family phage protein